MPARRRSTSALTCLLLTMAALPQAAAQDTFTSNDFEIDAVTGPVLGSSRVVGMGGAYTALAEDIDGAHFSPASFGSRPPYEFSWFSYGLSLSYCAPGIFGLDDFFNNGSGIGVEKFSFLSLGLRLQFGSLGIGADTRLQIYNTGSAGETINVFLIESHAGVAYAFFGGQLIVGLGTRVADLDLKLADDTTLVHFTGAGVEGGVLLKLADMSWRLGVSGRGPVESGPDKTPGVEVRDGTSYVKNFVLPRGVHMPWEIQLGFAWQFGPRPMNRVWSAPPDPQQGPRKQIESARCKRAADQLSLEKPDREGITTSGECPKLIDMPRDEIWWAREKKLREAEERLLEKMLSIREAVIEHERRKEYESLPKSYLLISADFFIIGGTTDGVGIDSFVEQKRRSSGDGLSFGFRLGAETEIWSDRLKLRAGFYLEPPRYAGVPFRPHGTGGLELRLFRWDLFGYTDPFDLRASLTVDVAPGYLDIGAGIGFWH